MTTTAETLQEFHGFEIDAMKEYVTQRPDKQANPQVMIIKDDRPLCSVVIRGISQEGDRGRRQPLLEAFYLATLLDADAVIITADSMYTKHPVNDKSEPIEPDFPRPSEDPTAIDALISQAARVDGDDVPISVMIKTYYRDDHGQIVMTPEKDPPMLDYEGSFGFMPTAITHSLTGAKRDYQSAIDDLSSAFNDDSMSNLFASSRTYLPVMVALGHQILVMDPDACAVDVNAAGLGAVLFEVSNDDDST